MYAFIPDGSMVGTVFINAFASAATTIGQGARLSIEMAGEAKITSVEGVPASQYRPQSWGGIVTLPLLQESRVWDVCVKLDRPLASLEDIAVKLVYKNSAGSTETVTETASIAFSPEVRMHHAMMLS